MSLESLAQAANIFSLPNEKNQQLGLRFTYLPDSLSLEEGYGLLSVYVKNEAHDYQNAIQGQFSLEGEQLFFKPYYPFEEGLTYRMRFKSHPKNDSYAWREFKIGEKAEVAQAELLKIYPTATELPENLLRFYFYFQTPMQREVALDHISLIDEEGKEDRHAFMEFKQELWSADGKRLTLLFDPGRIKRGVSTNLALGPALVKGKQYTLRVSEHWEDVYGQALSQSISRTFSVGPAYRIAIDIHNWHLKLPKAGSAEALHLQFDRIMDHALIASMIQIRNENKEMIEGHWEVSEKELSAHFIPDQAWQAGPYQLVLDPSLEDIAGNNIEGLLDQAWGNSTKQVQNRIRPFFIR